MENPQMNGGLFSSDTYEWGTPQTFFDQLDREFDFTLDACATPQNAKCVRFFTKRENGLAHPWPGVVWMNPPYGREIALWIEKAYREAQMGAVVVALVPARTDTRWWHDYVMRAAEVRLVRGRMNFDGVAEKGHNAPFPNAVVVFRQGEYEPRLSALSVESADSLQMSLGV